MGLDEVPKTAKGYLNTVEKKFFDFVVRFGWIYNTSKTIKYLLKNSLCADAYLPSLPDFSLGEGASLHRLLFKEWKIDFCFKN